MARVYKPITPTPLIFQNRSILREWAPGMGPSICLHAEVGPPNFGLPPSFPSILGKKGENVSLFGGSGFFQHTSETRAFLGLRPEKLRPHSDSQGSKFRPTGSQPNAKSGPKKCRLRDRIVDFDVPESDFRAAAQHGLMRGGGRPSTTSSRARRTPSRRHRDFKCTLWPTEKWMPFFCCKFWSLGYYPNSDRPRQTRNFENPWDNWEHEKKISSAKLNEERLFLFSPQKK